MYSDRDYVYNSIPPSLEGKTYIITANEDKFSHDDTFLRFQVAKEVIVYVAHGDRYANKPAWLSKFEDTGENLTFNVDGDVVTLSLYKKHFPPGQIALGGNITPTETQNHAMYAVVVSEG